MATLNGDGRETGERKREWRKTRETQEKRKENQGGREEGGKKLHPFSLRQPHRAEEKPHKEIKSF